MVRFDTDEFVAQCLASVRADGDARSAVRELVERAVSDPGAIEGRDWLDPVPLDPQVIQARLEEAAARARLATTPGGAP